ncbi:hypothetical protein HW555_002943 [Spodoptera exigua]|uniref:Uncharacterized protein n=1 Tax=Spodoptera exigua TaxID=7107 RepID=A0A835GNT5_SPOEX|nr:hypothetical protein HW555_002943 [Spodoptera exigua]
MAMASIDLATFKFVSELLPKYDGNPKILNYFIKEVENVMLLLDPQLRVNPAIVSLIKSKLSGSAISAIASEETVDSWQTIKAALTRRLGEPRNEIQLMQELTRLRRNKNEDAETFCKRLREILDTLNVVGRHTDKSYYESMVIDQYVNHLDFHVSIGVRIAQPAALEAAIVTARQEEARLAFNRLNNSFNTLSIQNKPKETPKPNQTVPQNSNFSPRNSWNIDQRQQRSQGIPQGRPTPGNVRPSGSGTVRNSGNFRSQPNIPRQQVNPPQKVSDVTMRSRMTNKDDPIQLLMKYAIIAYNNAIHSTTGYTPPELLFGHTASRNPLELYYPKEFYQDYVLNHRKNAEAIQDCIAAHVSKNKEQLIEKRNQAAEAITFKVGETVYKQVAKTTRSDKTKPVFKGPYKIIHLHPNNVAEIIGSHPNSKSIRVHLKLLRRQHLVPGPSSSEPSCSTQPQT